ncbi:MAG TPA: aldo/keto reductase [Solirubrobacteraceae bacterium]|nr:aldo/keto reductase [Solirubrobacteraceae bacterium]
MRQRSIGTARVGAIGYGAMPLSAGGRPDEEQALATVRAAVEAGVTLIDTADAYGLGPDDVGHGEALLARLLRRLGAEDVVVATKGGHTRTADGGWALDGRPEHLTRAAEASLRRLGRDAIDLYQYHRPDPDVPYAESLGALAELARRGVVRMVGVSNADPAQIRLAREIVGDAFVAVQNELSPGFRSSEPEVRLCEELGLAFLAWSPLGGTSSASRLGDEHAAFAQVAAERGVSPQRVCLAWLLARSPAVIPIPGARRPETVRDSAAAADLDLTPSELARLG